MTLAAAQKGGISAAIEAGADQAILYLRSDPSGRLPLWDSKSHFMRLKKDYSGL
jgi:hypothetical protein